MKNRQAISNNPVTIRKGNELAALVLNLQGVWKGFMTWNSPDSVESSKEKELLIL